MQYIPSLSIIPHGSWRKKFEIFSTWLPFVCHTDWNELWQHYFRWKQCAAMQKRRRAALGFLSSYSNSWFVVTEPEEQIRFCIFFKQISGTEWYIMFILLQFSSFILPSKDPKMALVCVCERTWPVPSPGCIPAQWLAAGIGSAEKSPSLTLSPDWKANSFWGLGGFTWKTGSEISNICLLKSEEETVSSPSCLSVMESRCCLFSLCCYLLSHVHTSWSVCEMHFPVVYKVCTSMHVQDRLLFRCVCTNPVFSTHCHHRPIGKPPPTISATSKCVCVLMWMKLDMYKGWILMRIKGFCAFCHVSQFETNTVTHIHL